MDYLVISLTALAAAVLAFFSGFGLGTLLLPAFLLFFPVDVAVAATAVVHLINNLFRLSLTWRQADRSVALRFGLPAVLTAVAGAWLLGRLTNLPVLFSYAPGGHAMEVTPVKLAVGIVIVAVAAVDLVPRLRGLAFPRRLLPLGGAISGFFGGLSGHQGALRSSFLIKTGLKAAAFIGTTSIIASGVDVVRLAVYGSGYYADQFRGLTAAAGWGVLAAVAAALAGSLAGNHYKDRVKTGGLRVLVGGLCVAAGVALGTGLI